MTLAEITAPWLALHSALGVAAPIKDEAHYKRLVEFSQQLAERLPDDANDPLWALVSLIAERIAEYERKAHRRIRAQGSSFIKSCASAVAANKLSMAGAQTTVEHFPARSPPADSILKSRANPGLDLRAIMSEYNQDERE